MLLEDMEAMLPMHWLPMNIFDEKYKIVQIPPYTLEYQEIEEQVRGNYYVEIEGIYKIQNPHLYTKFALKKNDYGHKGEFTIERLYHDTCRENVQSIALYNFDWRYAERYKYGPGVYFSSSPHLANKHSSKFNGVFRSMFLVEVLVQNPQFADHQVFLPDAGYDTVVSMNNATFVKYFDCEYYPHYFVNYISI